jgi:hypothetical protein
MPQAMRLGMTLLLIPLGSAPACDPPNPGANAALKYWQAFATLPRFTAGEAAKLLEECQSMPLDAPARGMAAEARYALDMMRRGAALPYCDWGIGWADEGIGNRLPHLDGARQLSALACLRARLRFAEGQSAEAIADILAAMAMGRHASRDGSLPAILTGYAIERRMSETLARSLPKLDAKTLRDLKKRLDALPAGGRLATGVREEQILETGWFVRQVKEAKDEASVVAFLSQLWNGPGEGRALLDECGGTRDGVIKCAEELRAWYPLLAKQMELPLEEFEKEQDQAAANLAANPMYKRFVPGILRCRWLKAQADVGRALLSAALAVQLEGQGVLKDHPDTVVGGSFDYVAFKDGFELRSKWIPDAKLRAKRSLGSEPLVLTVGRAGD